MSGPKLNSLFSISRLGNDHHIGLPPGHAAGLFESS
jgi:hypothetical protein